MTKIDELLAVLDMTKEEQFAFLENYPDKTIDGHKVLIEGEWRLPKNCLPALAFRLRDEAKKKHNKEWYRACFIVFEKFFNPRGGREFREYRVCEEEHEILCGKPIWWIITALKAKELAGKEMADG